jgi:hypothetical protein
LELVVGFGEQDKQFFKTLQMKLKMIHGGIGVLFLPYVQFCQFV